jgi:hypothetical protein
LISSEEAFEAGLFSILKKPLQTNEMAEKIKAARGEA